MKPKPEIVVKPRVKTGRPDLDALHTRQLLDRLGSERAKITYINGLFGEPADGERQAVEAEMNAIKAVLATREHIPSKAEAKKIRQDRAKQCR